MQGLNNGYVKLVVGRLKRWGW